MRFDLNRLLLHIGSILGVGMGIFIVVVGQGLGYIIALIIIVAMEVIILICEIWERKIVRVGAYVKEDLYIDLEEDAYEDIVDIDFHAEQVENAEEMPNKKHKVYSRIQYVAVIISMLTAGIATIFCFVL